MEGTTKLLMSILVITQTGTRTSGLKKEMFATLPQLSG